MCLFFSLEPECILNKFLPKFCKSLARIGGFYRGVVLAILYGELGGKTVCRWRR